MSSVYQSSVYHWKQPGFRGERLYPLNRLAAVYPDLYAAGRAKYAGRERLLDEIIPVLDMRWNDVVFCTPIHPHHIYRALRAAGDMPNPARLFFKIPVERLRGRPVALWHYRQDDLTAEDIEPFSEEDYHELTTLPAEASAYFAEVLSARRRPLLRGRYRRRRGDRVEHATLLKEAWAGVRLDPTTGPNVVAFSSGGGDGRFPSAFGYAEGDEPLCLAT